MTRNIFLQSYKRIKYFYKIAIFTMRKIKYIMRYIEIKNKTSKKIARDKYRRQADIEGNIPCLYYCRTVPSGIR